MFRLISVITFVLSILLSACAESKHNSNESTREEGIDRKESDHISKERLTLYDLDSTMRIECQRLIENWQSNHLGTCGALLEIEMNCTDCPGVALDVLLRIGNAGNVDSVMVLNNMIQCKGTQFEAELLTCILESIRASFQFTEQFSHRNIELRLGNLLKC